MNKVLSLLIVTILIFAACEKERGDAVACIDLGNSALSSADSIHFMNCSQNFDYTKWTVLDATNTTVIYAAPSDTLKHFVYQLAPGTYNVNLNVYQADSVSHSQITEVITVNP